MFILFILLQKTDEKEKLIEAEPDIKSLPSIVFEGRIVFANEFNDCAAICDKLLYDFNLCIIYLRK